MGLGAKLLLGLRGCFVRGQFGCAGDQHEMQLGLFFMGSYGCGVDVRSCEGGIGFAMSVR
jgi:hypothetical protein